MSEKTVKINREVTKILFEGDPSYKVDKLKVEQIEEAVKNYYRVLAESKHGVDNYSEDLKIVIFDNQEDAQKMNDSLIKPRKERVFYPAVEKELKEIIETKIDLVEIMAKYMADSFSVNKENRPEKPMRTNKAERTLLRKALGLKGIKSDWKIFAKYLSTQNLRLHMREEDLNKMCRDNILGMPGWVDYNGDENTMLKLRETYIDPFDSITHIPPTDLGERINTLSQVGALGKDFRRAIFCLAHEENDPGKEEIAEAVIELTKCGVIGITTWANVLMVTLKPKYSYFNGTNQLHRQDGPAVEWFNGKKQWFIHGIEFDEKQFVNPDDMSVDDVLLTENIEQRQALMRAKGPESLMKEKHAKLVDKSEETGNELYEIKMKAGVIKSWSGREENPDITVRLLKYTCPSTGRIYMKFVPTNSLNNHTWGKSQTELNEAELDTADKAMAWSHYYTLNDYLSLKAQS